MEQMDSLTFQNKQRVIMGVPFEKIRAHKMITVDLLHRNDFVPTLPNNQIYTQGYFDTIKSFVDAVEGRKVFFAQSLNTCVNTYSLIDTIQNLIKQQK